MNVELIFWPVIIMALITLAIYIPMYLTRVRMVREGKAKVSDFRVISGEPEESLKLSNAIRNQYETPVLFYCVCISAFVTNQVSTFFLYLAFIYVAVKGIHITILATKNRLRNRMPIFGVSWLVLLLMWLVFAANLAMKTV